MLQYISEKNEAYNRHLQIAYSLPWPQNYILRLFFKSAVHFWYHVSSKWNTWDKISTFYETNFQNAVHLTQIFNASFSKIVNLGLRFKLPNNYYKKKSN